MHEFGVRESIPEWCAQRDSNSCPPAGDSWRQSALQRHPALGLAAAVAYLGPGCRTLSERAKTFDDLDQALTLAGNADALMMLEVVLPKQDVPELLARITRGVAKVYGSVA